MRPLYFALPPKTLFSLQEDCKVACFLGCFILWTCFQTKPRIRKDIHWQTIRDSICCRRYRMNGWEDFSWFSEKTWCCDISCLTLLSLQGRAILDASEIDEPKKTLKLRSCSDFLMNIVRTCVDWCLRTKKRTTMIFCCYGTFRDDTMININSCIKIWNEEKNVNRKCTSYY